MVDESNPWPDYDKPATKGDVIGAIVHTRSCLIDIRRALIGLGHRDNERALQEVEALSRHDRQLQKLIDKIGGKADG